MDTSEATEVVMSRIKSLDPENASKIMGYILIQDQVEKEMIRLAFGPESLLLSHIHQAKACLGLLSSSSVQACSTPTSPFAHTSPRILVPKNGFLSTPSSPAAAVQRPFSSYAAAVNGSNAGACNNTSSSPRLHFYGGNDFLSSGGHNTVQDQLPFSSDDLNPIVSPSGRSGSMVYPYGEDLSSRSSPHTLTPFHRRSCSVNDAAFFSNLEEGGGFQWRPCVYFARGFCKNGSSCKFLHSDVGVGEGDDVGPPSKVASGFDELLRMKALQNHGFAFMASGGHRPFVHRKGLDFLDENLRHDYAPMGLAAAGAGSSSRQIYLTFPADSTFKEEDVSYYFSTYGPVQDVRIPYQQKRMFGFVTFVYSETVKVILAKGNPHFICDSRVLVKPYKEKGKLTDKKQQHQQHLERGDYSVCLSPSGPDSTEHRDLPTGRRMLYTPREMMLRKIDEAELQYAIELQNQRMMNMQLVDLKIQHHNNPFSPRLEAGIPISSPRLPQLLMNPNSITGSDFFNQEDLEEFDGNREAAKSPVIVDQKSLLEGTESCTENNAVGIRHQSKKEDGSDLPQSLEHILPDKFFASPTKAAAELYSGFYQALANDTKPVTNSPFNNNTTLLPSSSPLSLCYNQLARFSSGQGTIEM